MRQNYSIKSTSLPEWREQVGRHIVHLDFEPAPTSPFRALLKPMFEDRGLRVALAATSAGATVRDRTLAKRGAPSYDLLIAKQNAFEIEHLGRRLRLRPGDGVVLQNWEPGRLTGGDPTAYVSIVLPAERVHAASASPPTAGRLIRRENRALRLLRGYLGLLEAQGGGDDVSLLAGGHILDLALASAGSALDDDAARSKAAARTACALSYIERNFAQPDLSAERAAVDLGISRRYLENLMERTGISFGKRVLERRLTAAYDGLVADVGGTRISDIALRCGFSDISYFTRCFRTRYGASPGTVRK